jgi:hypothetical protein
VRILLGVLSNSVALKLKTLCAFLGLVKILGDLLDLGLRVWSGSFLRCFCDLRCRAQFFYVTVTSHLPHVLFVSIFYYTYIYIYTIFKLNSIKISEKVLQRVNEMFPVDALLAIWEDPKVEAPSCKHKFLMLTLNVRRK